MACALLLLAALLVGSAHAVSVAPAILNGKDAPKMPRFDYLASVRYPYAQMQWSNKTEGEHVCAGALIAPDVVLTTGFCATIAGWFPTIRLANYKTNGNYYVGRKVVKTVINAAILAHPDTYESDIAMFKLDKPVDIAPVKFCPSLPMPPYPFGTQMTIAGWGAVFNGQPTNAVANNLKTGTLVLQDGQKCAELWPAVDGFDSNRITCAKFVGHRKAGCWGDSASALIKAGASNAEDVLVGLLVQTDCDPQGSAYSSTARNSYWIRQGLNLLAGKTPPNIEKYAVFDKADYPTKRSCANLGRPCSTSGDCCDGNCTFNTCYPASA